MKHALVTLVTLLAGWTGLPVVAGVATIGYVLALNEVHTTIRRHLASTRITR